MSKVLDLSHLIGQKFNRLTILKDLGQIPVDYQKAKERRLEVQCECGTIKQFRYDKVTKGQFKSCGRRGFSEFMKGCKKHSLYDVYHGMKQRCNNPKDSDFSNYGARGIKVCAEWEESIEAFFLWCLSNGWEKGLHLDRKENNEGYGPNNCRFVTPAINNSNKRSSKLITYNGETFTVAQWAEKLGIHRNRLKFRIDKGWPLERALVK